MLGADVGDVELAATTLDSWLEALEDAAGDVPAALAELQERYDTTANAGPVALHRDRTGAGNQALTDYEVRPSPRTHTSGTTAQLALH